ncbi:MAG: glutamate--tRNA ligase [Ardenticatenaceae bacterium]|nr:glutamate--tRNA ligase [Anaerolineales bacterium]MCB8921143.1 glutamate--tRNA ligase [Ardenticatenaceae bacterium]MCB8990848.1 glutamate--tRNA ligase [Ardenticatenaceae bacterium]MCB9004458.1 glutamate--tRNA ligase [Ardenticatenaceae bacterium]
MTVRVRFAPSPTGYLHIGGARTALFNWLFARKHGGQFILRIEDTDQKRTVAGAIEAIMDGLRWLGLDWDEGPDVGGPVGPYVQTERAELYCEWANWLVEHGYAYKCFCTPEELDEMRKEQMAKKEMLGYNGRCRHLTPDQIAAKETAGLNSVIRFKMPRNGETTIQDAIRGPITYQNSQIIDAVLLKSDGLPTYHLANVVDDHFMQITHIMRADEWINTAPLHINLYHAFGWELPVYAHLSLVMNPSGKGKLSKRTQAFDDDGQQVLVKVEEFQEAGYLPQAVVNFLANVGYATGDDREKFDAHEAIDSFRLEKINPAPSRLPYSKLDWLNGQYIQEMEPQALARAVKPFLDAQGFEVNPEALLVVMPAMSKRLKRLPEAIDFLRFLFDDVPLNATAEMLTHKKMPYDAAKRGFQEARDFVATVEPFNLDTVSTGLMKIGESVTTNEKAGPFLGQMRFAITGQQVSPPLFESMVALGRARTLTRLDEVLQLF